MPRERAAGTTPHAISEYRSSRMTDNARVAEERKWEVAKERRGLRGERGGDGLEAKGEAENTVVSLSTSNSLYSPVRSLARSPAASS